ncbi:MAG: hypothetical protein AB2L11_05865 [Syntrophobacteraceae bacterium]
MNRSIQTFPISWSKLGYGLWAMGYGLWAMGYGLWAMGYGLWAMGYGLWKNIIYKGTALLFLLPIHG